MKALVKYENGEGNVRLVEMPKPEISTSQVLIRVKAAGICGTDIHILKDASYPVRPPVILGHEVAGIVEEVGADVTGWKKGDKVVTETYYSTCGHCFFCKTGNPNLCEEKLSIGSAVNGGMAEYVKVPAANLHHLPGDLPFEVACMTEPFTCCVQGVFQHGDLQPDDTVAVMGPGTIGLLTLQVIKLFGCKAVVLGTKKDEERLAMAKKLGADEIMYVEDADVFEKVRAFSGGLGVDAVFECSGAGPAIRMAMDLMRKGARFTQVGIPGKEVPLDLGKIVLREYTINGTYATRPVWWDKAVALIDEGKVQIEPLMSSVSTLEEWEAGFDKAIKGEGFKHIIVPE